MYGYIARADHHSNTKQEVYICYKMSNINSLEYSILK